MKQQRPAFCADEMLDFLDELRESGTTNMFGAARDLDDEFPGLADGAKGYGSSLNAKAVLKYWMDTFGDATR